MLDPAEPGHPGDPASAARPQPDWLIEEPDAYVDVDLGPLKTGKEAEVFLVERRAMDGRRCVLVHKRYRPRRVTAKGELQRLGFQGASTFVNDAAYRDGRQLAKSRDRRAAAKKTEYGRGLLRRDWATHELVVLTRLWHGGVHVPYPVGPTADGLLMEYVGDLDGAAARLAQARLTPVEAATAASQLRDDLHDMVRAGFVHGDLSPYNLLWWQGRVWIIDVPQAVEVGSHLGALDLLLRDLRNVGAWFARQHVPFDPDQLFAELLSTVYG